MRLGRDRGHAGFAGHEHLGAFADGLGDQAVLATFPGEIRSPEGRVSLNTYAVI